MTDNNYPFEPGDVLTAAALNDAIMHGGGVAGPPGTGITADAGVPTGVAEDGSLYINTTNGDLYEMQVGVWRIVGNLAGPPGPPGQSASGGAAGGDLAGTYPNPQVIKTSGTVFAASATKDTTNATNITTGTLPAARLPTSGVTPGSYTVASLTVDATGRLTAASNGTAGGTGTVTNIATGTGLTGGPITNAGTVSLATRTASTLMGNPGTGTATPSDIAIGSGLSLSTGGTLAVGALTYAQLPTEVAQIPITFAFSGKPSTGAIANAPMVMSLTVPASLAGATVYASTKATSNAAFIVNRITGGTTITAIGTVTATSASNTSATLSGTGATLGAADTLQVVAPTQDASLSDFSITLLAARV